MATCTICDVYTNYVQTVQPKNVYLFFYAVQSRLLHVDTDSYTARIRHLKFIGKLQSVLN